MKHHLYPILLGCLFATYNGVMVVVISITETVEQLDIFIKWFTGDVVGVLVVTYLLIILDRKWNRKQKLL